MAARTGVLGAQWAVSKCVDGAQTQNTDERAWEVARSRARAAAAWLREWTMHKRACVQVSVGKARAAGCADTYNVQLECCDLREENCVYVS